MLDEVLIPVHQQFAQGFVLDPNSLPEEYKNISEAHFHSLLIGAANVFFALSFQNKREFGIDTFDPDEIDRYVDFVNDTVFARFEK